jgi:hypothetical protein
MIHPDVKGGKKSMLERNKEITPSYLNDPLAQEINRIYDSKSYSNLTKEDNNRIEELRNQQWKRDSTLRKEYDDAHPSNQNVEKQPTETERQAKRLVDFSSLINPKTRRT